MGRKEREPKEGRGQEMGGWERTRREGEEEKGKVRWRVEEKVGGERRREKEKSQ